MVLILFDVAWQIRTIYYTGDFFSSFLEIIIYKLMTIIMTIRFYKIAILLLISLSSVFSQELYVCESYTEDGSPVGVQNQFEIKPYGTAVYVLLDNEKEFNDPLLYLFIDKLIDGKFTPFESKTISIKITDTWAVTSFEFKEEGIYEIYFLNSSQNRLATTKISTQFSIEFSDQTITASSNTITDGDFIFCELVINGKPVNAFNTLSLSRTAGQAFIYLNNNTPFNLGKLKVQVWKRKENDSSYEELVDTKKFKILPEWNDTFFKYIFTNIGEFKIDVLDSTDSFISSNIITVTN